MYFSSQKTQWRLCEETKFVKFGGFVFKKKFCGFRGFCVRHREAARRRRGDIKTGGTISHRATPHHHKLLLRNCCFSVHIHWLWLQASPIAVSASEHRWFLLPLTPYLLPKSFGAKRFLLPLTTYLLPFIFTSLP